jgi:precorrin-3B synthase
MNAPLRRGACPGLSTPMQTGDGLLARLTPASGTIPLDAFANLCAAARTHGNGIVEITTRGNIQVRGLSPTSAPNFAAAMAISGVEGNDGVPIIADPLNDLDANATIDTGSLAATLRRALTGAPFVSRLGPKVSVSLDGGGALHLDALAADVRLRAERLPHGTRIHVAVGGNAATAASIGTIAPERALDVTMRLLDTIAMRGSLARARDMIRTEGIGIFRAAVTDQLIDLSEPRPRPASEPIGVHRLRGGQIALGIGLAFGYADSNILEILVETAKRAGASGIRTAPGRTLLVIGMTPHRAAPFATAVERFGFIVRSDDPRRHITACAGAPICASAAIPTRALGPKIAEVAATLLDGSLTLHMSGCSKGCAHNDPAALTIIGSSGGCGIVIDGTAGDTPLDTIAMEVLPSGLTRLAREVEGTRCPGEQVLDTLRRLGTARVMTIFQEVGDD